MKKLAVLAAVAALALGSVHSSEAEARNGRRTAAVVGAVTGLAAGALIAGAISQSQAAPGYSYGGGYGYAPSYGYGPAPAYGYAPAYRVSPAYAPVVVRSRPRYDDFEEECRIVVRRKVNAWGEVVTRRTEICD